MNDLINVNFDKQTVSARELHEALGIEKRFSAWFETNSQGFVEGEDFTSVPTSTVVNNGALRELDDYQCSIDMAKHICLMSRTDKGKMIRQYFIELEKAWNTPEQIMARALRVADEKIKSLSQEIVSMTYKIEEMQPKATYYDEILNSKDTVLVTQIAKDYGMSAKSFNKLLHDLEIQHKVNGQWVLYSKYQGNGFTHSHTYKFEHYNGEIGNRMATEWTQKGRIFLYNFLKEHDMLPVIERN